VGIHQIRWGSKDLTETQLPSTVMTQQHNSPLDRCCLIAIWCDGACAILCNLVAQKLDCDHIVKLNRKHVLLEHWNTLTMWWKALLYICSKTAWEITNKYTFTCGRIWLGQFAFEDDLFTVQNQTTPTQSDTIALAYSEPTNRLICKNSILIKILKRVVILKKGVEVPNICIYGFTNFLHMPVTKSYMKFNKKCDQLYSR